MTEESIVQIVSSVGWLIGWIAFVFAMRHVAELVAERYFFPSVPEPPPSMVDRKPDPIPNRENAPRPSPQAPREAEYLYVLCPSGHQVPAKRGEQSLYCNECRTPFNLTDSPGVTGKPAK